MAYVPDIIPPDERARYAKGNMGTRVGFGVRPAVLVVDKVNPFDIDMKYGDVVPLADVRAHFARG
jgi:hypothetical protein